MQKNFRKKLFAIILAILIIWPSVVSPALIRPPKAQAQAADLIKTAMACAAGAFANYGILTLWSKFSLGDPLAVPENESGLRGKEVFLDLAGKCLNKIVFDVMVKSLIKSIQNIGRDGGPAFVQDWRSFQTQASYRGEDVLRQMLANTNVCPHVKNQLNQTFVVRSQINIAGQTLRAGTWDPFQYNARCTLPNGFDIEAYKQDFAGNGGWEAFSRLTQPNNNYLGLLMMSMDEAERQRAIEITGDISEVIAGSGYTSPRDVCRDAPIHKCSPTDEQLTNCQVTCAESNTATCTGPTLPGACSHDSSLVCSTSEECQTDQLNQCITQCEANICGQPEPSLARCTFLGKVFTPADLLGKTTAATIDQNLGWFVSSEELSEAIITVTSALVNRLVNLAFDNP